MTHIRQMTDMWCVVIRRRRHNQISQCEEDKETEIPAVQEIKHQTTRRKRSHVLCEVCFLFMRSFDLDIKTSWTPIPKKQESSYTITVCTDSIRDQSCVARWRTHSSRRPQGFDFYTHCEYQCPTTRAPRCRFVQREQDFCHLLWLCRNW